MFTNNDAIKLCEYVTGMSEAEAKRIIESQAIDIKYGTDTHCIWRIIRLDGRGMVKTNDHKMHRINLYIDNGIVTGARPG